VRRMAGEVGHRRPSVRLAVVTGRLDPVALKPGADWPELHDNYQEVLEKLRGTLNPEDEANDTTAAVKDT
jgi:hypothetical protein